GLTPPARPRTPGGTAGPSRRAPPDTPRPPVWRTPRRTAPPARDPARPAPDAGLCRGTTPRPGPGPLARAGTWSPRRPPSSRPGPAGQGTPRGRGPAG